MTVDEDVLQAQRDAAEAALAEWSRQWADYHGTGDAHAAAIRAWATPTRPAASAPPPAETGTPVEERVSAWLDRATEAIERIKMRRGQSLYEPLLSGRGQWNEQHCGREGCECSHGKYRSQGDFCDRGWIPPPGDGEGPVQPCPRCRRNGRENPQ